MFSFNIFRYFKKSKAKCLSLSFIYKIEDNESKIYKYARVHCGDVISKTLCKISKRIINIRDLNCYNTRTLQSILELTDTVVSILNNYKPTKDQFLIDNDKEKIKELESQVTKALENLDKMIALLLNNIAENKKIDIVSTCSVINKLAEIKGL